MRKKSRPVDGLPPQVFRQDPRASAGRNHDRVSRSGACEITGHIHGAVAHADDEHPLATEVDRLFWAPVFIGMQHSATEVFIDASLREARLEMVPIGNN